MSINIDVTFVISVAHKQKMYLALDYDDFLRLSFFRNTIIEYDDTSGIIELKKTIRSYIATAIAPLLSCKIGIKMHEFVNSARATVYIEVLFKEQFKKKNLKLVTPAKASGMPCTPDVEMFLYQYYQAKKKLDMAVLTKDNS